MTSRRVYQHLRPLLGMAFIVVLLLAVWATTLSYTKALPWQDTTDVTLTTRRAGVGLSPPSDVKFQGLRVGEVREISSAGRDAVLHIALDPRYTELIPANVDAAIIPKTLFGEKYVDLRNPGTPVSARISEGGRIRQSTTAVEISQLFDNLASVLDTLKPEQLSVTLNSVADAVQGRGAKTGETLELVHTYLSRFSPHLDTLVGDLRKTAGTADVYSAAADDLVRVLDNSRVISTDLLRPRERSFASFLDSTITAAGEATDLLETTGRDIVTLTGDQRPVLAVLATYAPELPCMADALARLDRAANKALGGQGPYLQASVDVLVDRPSYRYSKDFPGNPGSDAHNAALPHGISSWEPHCPVVPQWFAGLADNHRAVGEPEPTDAVHPLAGLMLGPILRGAEVRVP